MSSFNKQLESNLRSWEDRTPIHLESKFYDLKAFKNGKTSLNSIELNALGDVNHKSILHLQCHFGQDSLSWAKMGAKVTGVDFSPSAISAAQQLAHELNISAEFIESNVLTLDLNKQFDIVFMSYGTLGWLPDLKTWGKVVSKHLKKGGVFFISEFHPLIDLLDINTQYGYFFDKNTPTTKETGSYTDGGEHLNTEYCWWSHSLTEIFTSLESNGLKLKSFEEFDYSPYHLRGMVKRNEGEFVLEKRAKQSLPYVFTLKAIKK